jgi:hypothetical protein
MQNSHNAVREGFVSVGFGFRDQLVLKGLPVMGRSSKGELINRQVLISKKAPSWFQRLCFDRANTEFKVRVRIVATYEGHLAFAVPVANSVQEALQEWEKIRPQAIDPKTALYAVMTEETFIYATRAHEHLAQQYKLNILEHKRESERVYSTAIDETSGRKYVVTGGFIVSKLKDKIESGDLNWDKQVTMFVRARPLV